MKTSKILLIDAVLLLITVGIYSYYSRNKQVALPPTVEVSQGQKEITWSYEDMGTNQETGTPSTKVTVSIGDKNYTVGTYAGSCSPRSHDGFGENEISGITCWWAGGGDDIGVFSTNGGITIQHRTLDEGTAEEGGIISNFETVISI